uniref:Cytochrome P450 90B1 n=1 Tax=Ananas comosus var. bracteatus TaxID=296719 RepID=A0A6V7QKR8_ANACO|nr:unnamed protein product [Ananas comosus var. bracteatus]
MMVVSADAELNRYVLQNEMRLFRNSLPAHFRKLIGDFSMAMLMGDAYRHKKTVLLASSTRPACRAASCAASSASRRPHGLLDRPRVIFATEEANKARANIVKTIKKKLDERKARGSGDKEDDLLGCLIEEGTYDWENICDTVQGFIFAGLVTSSTAMSLAMYFLENCPKALEQMRAQRIEEGKQLLPFGGGVRHCMGSELARVEISVFLHYLILNYNWESVEPDQPVSFPQVTFLKDLPIRVRAADYGL